LSILNFEHAHSSDVYLICSGLKTNISPTPKVLIVPNTLIFPSIFFLFLFQLSEEDGGLEPPTLPVCFRCQPSSATPPVEVSLPTL
jgi:hypothetical protein